MGYIGGVSQRSQGGLKLERVLGQKSTDSPQVGSGLAKDGLAGSMGPFRWLNEGSGMKEPNLIQIGRCYPTVRWVGPRLDVESDQKQTDVLPTEYGADLGGPAGCLVYFAGQTGKTGRMGHFW